MPKNLTWETLRFCINYKGMHKDTKILLYYIYITTLQCTEGDQQQGKKREHFRPIQSYALHNVTVPLVLQGQSKQYYRPRLLGARLDSIRGFTPAP